MRYNGSDIPGWLLPWLGGALAIAVVVILVFAVRSARDAGRPPRKRWGNAIGCTGGAIFLGTFAAGMTFDLDLMDGPIWFLLAGFVVAGVGGSMAGWERLP